MIEGNNLWNAVDLVARAGKEVDSLETELSIKLNERLKSLGGELGFNADAGDDDVLDSSGDWVRIASMLQWGLKEKRKKTKYKGHLSVMVVLWSEDGERDPCGKIPRVEVAYVTSEEDLSPNYFDAGTWFSPDGWDNPCVSTDGKCVIEPKSENSRNGSRWDQKIDWYFAIPLFKLESNDHIDRLIIDPIMKLLSGTAPEDALKNVPAIKFTIGKGDELLSTPA